jgi:GAF domain-containing protein
MVGVPMLKNADLIGVIIIYRREVRPFTDKQIELVQNFADQASSQCFLNTVVSARYG